MEILTNADDVRQLFRRNGWGDPAQAYEISQLTGGVSCRTWKIVSGASRWVLKQPLAKLETEVEWFSDIGRIYREADSLSLLSTILEDNSVPSLEFVDKDTHSIVMSCAPDTAENWKVQMLEGSFQERTASNAGGLLSKIHERSQLISAADQSKFENIQYFEELRIEPFHKYLAVKYPELLSPIEILIKMLRNRRSCFTHGDYSPKNMLINPDNSIVLLDFEVAHWGNPVFDVAYCLGHLMLKSWAFDRRKDGARLISAFLESYVLETDPLLPHLGLTLLARLDGTSTVDYVVDLDLRSSIRDISTHWIKSARKNGAVYPPHADAHRILEALSC